MIIKKSGGMLVLAFSALLISACATQPKSLYQWGNYQPQVYEYFKGQSKEKQIAVLEQDIELTRAKGALPPPGLHAHLGLLYAEIGSDDKASEQLLAEKKQFPESAAYIDFLLKKYQKQ